MDNRLDTMTKTFLGLTVGCARCHDHKFDAISTKDYYALTGLLLSSAYRQVPFEALEQNRRVAEQLQALRDARAAGAAEAGRRGRAAGHRADGRRTCWRRGMPSATASGPPPARRRSPTSKLAGTAWVAELDAGAPRRAAPAARVRQVALTADAEHPDGFSRCCGRSERCGGRRRRQGADAGAGDRRLHAAAARLVGRTASPSASRPAARASWIWDAGDAGARAGRLLRRPPRPGLAGDPRRSSRARRRRPGRVRPPRPHVPHAQGHARHPATSGTCVRGARQVYAPSIRTCSSTARCTAAAARSSRPTTTLAVGAARPDRYAGQRAEFEFTPAGDAPLAVAKVVESDQQPADAGPRRRPAGRGRSCPTSRSAPSRRSPARISRCSLDVADDLAADRIVGSPDADAGAPLADWLLRHPDLFAAGRLSRPPATRGRRARRLPTQQAELVKQVTDRSPTPPPPCSTATAWTRTCWSAASPTTPAISSPAGSSKPSPAASAALPGRLQRPASARAATCSRPTTPSPPA